jgi:hypothetical protein
MAPVVREVVDAPAQFVDRAVQRARHLAQLVVAVPGGRAREVSGGVTARYSGNRSTRRPMLAETSHAQIAATGSDAATPARVSHSTVRCCSATSVKGSDKRTNAMVGWVVWTTAYSVS